MAALTKKINFAAIVTVMMANPNGDPLDGGRPRTDYYGFGEISDECIKRKLRNRMQDMGYPIFVQSDDRKEDDFGSLSERAAATITDPRDRADYAAQACQAWMDVRAFGQVFAFKSNKGLSVGVRGPVTIQQVQSVSPVEIESMQITKSVNGEKTEKSGLEADKKASDTMGMKHCVKFGMYVVKGTINVPLAKKTGLSQEDADVLKECLRTMFVNDGSAARPEGSMAVQNVYWWQHNNEGGQYSAAKVFDSLKIRQKDPDAIPTSIDDYEITLEPLKGLEPEVLAGE